MSQQELQTVAPSSRWDTESTYNPSPTPGQVCSRFGTYVESTYAFDNPVFGLQPNEALLMDPQQRLLLEETLSAFHDADRTASDMNGTSTGVFLGYAFNSCGLDRPPKHCIGTGEVRYLPLLLDVWHV